MPGKNIFYSHVMYFDRPSINKFVIINKLYIPPQKNRIYCNDMQVQHGQYFIFFPCALHLTALARSPAAFRAVRSLGILQLPCCKELQRIVSRNADGPGIHEQYLANQSETYQTFCESKVASGGKKPLGIGVLIFDETKVSRILLQISIYP